MMDLKETYNKIAEDWVADHDKDIWGKAGADMFLSFLPKGATVLDVGCGGGIKTNYIAKQGYEASGVDFSEKMIEIAKRDYPSLEFNVLDMYDIDIYPKMVDGIFVQAALLHIKKDRVLEVLRKMKDKLNPGGVIYIAVKAMRDNGIEEEMKTENDYGYDYERFFSYFSLTELKDYFNQLDLELVWEGDADTSVTHWLQVVGKKV